MPMLRTAVIMLSLGTLGLSPCRTCLAQGKNLLDNPSFEVTIEKNQFGHVFKGWGGWKYEGDCDFRVGQVAHSGKRSCLLLGGAGPKIRTSQLNDLQPGRYKITAYIRGLDIGTGVWNSTTEFMFADKYFGLKKNGTFGWSRLTYVAEIAEKRQAGPSFGLWAPGYFWIDDASLVKVGNDVPLTAEPVLGTEEATITPPGDFGPDAVRCAECGYKNMPRWKTCYTCGTRLEAKKSVASGPATKLITSFEDKNLFENGTIFREHATDGTKALRIDKGYTVSLQPQDWLGYDFLEMDVYTDSKTPIPTYLEFHDAQTRDYWTRVNYNTVIPPGPSKLILPLKQLYVGEKSRPGRPLNLGSITKTVIAIGDNPPAPVYVDNLRVRRDDSPSRVTFDGLYAFDFGLSSSPVMEGFTPITQGTIYSKGRGYGLKNATIWRSFDVLQPEPLYEDFICIESGSLAVDVPNGRYRVFVNIDSPSGFWGEYQVYRKRTILAQDRPVITETMDFDTFKKKYFRFWNLEDLPSDDTFDKYQKVYFKEKTFDVDVRDGQLRIGFEGENWGCSVSAVVIFPVAKAAEGQRFLKYAEEKRRFYFDNYFKRVLHPASGDSLQPTGEDRQRGFVAFQRDFTKEVYYNDTPLTTESGGPLSGDAFAGEYEPVTMSLVPLMDLGRVTVTAGDLAGPAGVIPAAAIEVGFVSYRISRVTMEGSVYTIKPRFIMPTGTVDMPKNITRRFWLTVKTPATARPGIYRGRVTVAAEKGGTTTVPIEFRVRAGTLDPVDIPVGPYSYTISIPWYDDDPKTAQYNREAMLKSLKKLREYGFTSCSGLPHIAFRGFKNGKPDLDFTAADAEMKLVKQLGFLAVNTYGGGVSGFDAYYQDQGAMANAGFKDYADFIRTVYGAVQKHANSQGWIPVYYNLADEPLGDDLTRSTANAEAYRRAFPKGPPYFTGASSYAGNDPNNPHLRLGKALHAVSWNGHDEDSVKLLHDQGADWGFYNDGGRWTFGEYMYKAAKQFGMIFRICWHWNAAAGDPYYALDCREDDYSWCSGSPDGTLIPSLYFEELREGLGDYRRMITLARLAKEKAGTPAAASATALLTKRMAAFKLNQRDHDVIFADGAWREFRNQVDNAIEALRE
jgi:hypothetical protein